MAIKPLCDICKLELKKPGALIFGPPSRNRVTKYHLCGACYASIARKYKLR